MKLCCTVATMTGGSSRAGFYCITCKKRYCMDCYNAEFRHTKQGESAFYDKSDRYSLWWDNNKCGDCHTIDLSREKTR